MKIELRTLLMITVVAIAMPGSAVAQHVEAFTEPYERVAVPASEVGVIESLLVKEGDVVAKKQLLGKLDDAVLRSSLDVAKAAKMAMGLRRSAETELTMRQQHLQSYRSLQEEGNATSRELARADMEMLQSAARLQSVLEELEQRKLEYERVKCQIRQRQIESPIDGIIISIDKSVGEFVSPTDPVVLHIVSIDVLKAVFSVPRESASDLKAGQTVSVTLGHEDVPCDALIEFVSPIANPESNSVRVKIRIPNENRNHASGVTCRWKLTSMEPANSTAKQSQNPPTKKF